MTTTLRIATWNLRRPGYTGNERNVAIIEKLHEIEADVWVLTETNSAISPGPEYTAYTTSPLPFHRRGEATTMIWTRLPVNQEFATFTDLARAEPLAEPAPSGYYVNRGTPSVATCVAVQTPIGPLLVYGTIVTWFGDKGPSGDAGYEAEHRIAVEAHGTDWRRLAAHGPLCVAGDFNALLREPVGNQRGETREARRLWREALSGSNLVCATNAFDYNIDHICLSAAWRERVTEARQFQACYGSESRPVSDHVGVYVDVSLAA